MQNQKRLSALRILSQLLFWVLIWEVFLLHTFAADSGNKNAVPLTLTATTCQEEGAVPLRNLIFDLYETDLTDIPPSGTSANESYHKTLKATLMTDENGNAFFDALGEGVYLLTQQPDPAAGLQEPLFLRIEGEGVDLHLELLAEKAPEIQLDVNSLQQKSASFDMQQSHTWIIRSSIPAGICTARIYEITDVLDRRIHFLPGNTEVSVWIEDGTGFSLEEGVHYTIRQEILSDNGETAVCVRFSLLPEGMGHLASKIGRGEAVELRIRFRAEINRKAEPGESIPNDVHLRYENSAGLVYQADSDIPEVHTGGIHILKTNKEDQPLSGTEFMIAREATQAELEDETIPKEILHTGTETIAALYLPFYSGEEQAEKTYIAVTGEDGRAAIKGLAYGTYYLVESRAADGYNNSLPPVKVQIDGTSHLRANTVTLVNSKFLLPNTGGQGSTGIVAAGVFLVLSAVFLILSNRKRRI